jgi:hypothetical protein
MRYTVLRSMLDDGFKGDSVILTVVWGVEYSLTECLFLGGGVDRLSDQRYRCLGSAAELLDVDY